MNNIYSISLNAREYVVDHFIIENVLDSFTEQQRRVIAIAFAVFSCCMLLAYAYIKFKATSLDSREILMTDLGDGRFKKVHKNGTIEIGEFKNDKLQGEGKRFFPDEQLNEAEDLDEMERYPKGHSDVRSIQGTFVDDELCGEGEILFWDGRLYKGTFDKNLLINGSKNYSEVQDSEIESEKGIFKDDKMVQGDIFVKKKSEEEVKENDEKKDLEVEELRKTDEMKDEAKEQLEDTKEKVVKVGTKVLPNPEEALEKVEKQTVVLKPNEAQAMTGEAKALPLEEDLEKKEAGNVEEKATEEKPLPPPVTDKPASTDQPETEKKAEVAKVEETKAVTDTSTPSEIELVIKQGPDVYKFDIAFKDTILDLKKKLFEKNSQFEVERQRLIYSGKILKDEQTVESCKFTQDARTLQLAMKPITPTPATS